MRVDLSDILSDLGSLNSEQAFKRKLDRTFTEFGFNAFSYVGMRSEIALDPAGKRNPSDLIVLSNVNSQWMDYYLEAEFQDDDPVIKECLSSRLPIRWDENFRSNTRSQREARVMNEGTEFGIRRGMTVPVHGPSGELGIVSLYSNLTDKEFAAATDTLCYDLHVVCIHFHDAVQRALAVTESVPKPIKLTDRELEILRWTATGKTAWEIGAILKISERTVNFHLQNSMSKFGVHNKTHAASKAMSIGLIHP